MAKRVKVQIVDQLGVASAAPDTPKGSGAPASAPTLESSTQPAPTASVSRGVTAQGSERITVDIPPRTTSLTLRFEFGTADAADAPATESRPTTPAFAIGGGRNLGSLLFVTDTAALTDFIGSPAVNVIREAIHNAGYHLLDLAERGGAMRIGTETIADCVQEQLEQHLPEQVVILGGYDVVPAAQVDTIAPETPAHMIGTLRNRDPDSFIVWSDDVYVDVEGVGLPDTAISRIPDGHDALFTLKVLQAEPASARQRHGIRNSARPFVEAIFSTLPGRAPLLVSGPIAATDFISKPLEGSLAYYMLHGSNTDGKVFWGEYPRGRYVEALTVDTAPTDGLDTAVIGCCWGALLSSTLARDWRPGQQLAGRLPTQSIALRLLSAGARAVIGCTGVHYSPTTPPFDTASGPFHQALWHHLNSGLPPVVALLHAKYDFADTVKSLTDVNQLAIANKILSQFTCLGLGR